jgi:hypothetical protein
MDNNQKENTQDKYRSTPKNKLGDSFNNEEKRTTDSNNGKAKNKDKNGKKINDKPKIPWAVKALVITLFLSMSFGILAQLVVGGITTQNVYIAYILIVAIVIISIIADIIAVAATSCDVEPFLSMSARKVKGAMLAVKLTKNADVVSSICGDIIGDICGIISGACGAAIVAILAVQNKSAELVVGVAFSAVIAALMITGKAVGKQIAIKNANRIVFMLAKTLSVFSKK